MTRVSGSSASGPEDVGLGEVRLVAQAGEEREAQPAIARPVQDGRRQRARVGDECDPARQRHARREGGVEPARGSDPAEAVGAEHSDGLGAKPGPQLGLTCPPRLAGFAEPRGDHHRAAHALGDAILQGRQDGGRRHRDHREVNRAVDREERGGRGQSLDDVAPRIHGPDPPLEPCRAQVGDDAPADLRRVARGSHDGDAARVEEGGELPRSPDATHRRRGAGCSAHQTRKPGALSGVVAIRWARDGP